MSVDVLSILHNAAMNEDVFGNIIETVYYTASGGTEVEARAHVMRTKIETDTFNKANTNIRPTRIYIGRDYVPLVTVREDKVRLKIDAGSSEYVTRRVLDIIQNDELSYTLLVG